MNIYISRIELDNYRSSKKTVVDLLRTLSVLIGPNGSGKTNFLNGLLLLKKLARTPRHVTDDESIRSSCRVKVTFVVDKKELPLDAVISYITNERNVDEVVSAKQTWNFREFTGQDEPLALPLSSYSEIREFFPIVARGNSIAPGLDRDLNLYLSRRFGMQYGGNKPLPWKQLKIILKSLAKVHDFVRGINYYGASQYTDPSRCPTSFEMEEDRVLRRSPGRGWNEHEQFLYDLYTASKNPKSKYSEFLSIVGADGVRLIDTIKYEEIDVPANVYKVSIGGRVISREIKRHLVIPNVFIGETKLSPNQLSEGTFKTLAIVFYLVTDTSRLLILEEPEVCIHHGLLASIVELVKDFAHEKQIIISTHSDFVLDALAPENVFVVRNDVKKGTIIKHIPKALSARDYEALKEYLRDSGNLGEYWRHGELEK